MRTRASGVAVIHKDLILLGKRIEFWEGKPVSLGGYWSVFAGSIEEGESPIVCATRELFEETEIKCEVTDIKYIRTISDEDVELNLYALELNELINPKLNEEHTEFGWFKIEHMDKIGGKVDPKIIKSVNFYVKNKYKK